LLRIAARNLWRRKSRSLLAILALVIGVLAIVLLISLTSGLKASYNDLLSGIGGIYVMEKGAADNTLSKLDASYGEELEQIPGVKAVLPEVIALNLEIDGQKPKGGSSLMMGIVAAIGLDPAKEQQRVGNPYGVDLVRGRKMGASDRDFAILGNKLADTYKKVVGSTIEVNGKKLKVIGIFGKSDIMDSYMAIHIDDAREFAGYDKETVQDFIVQLTDPQKEEQIATTIKFKWPDKLEVWTTSEMSNILDDMMGIIDQFFWIIALIALAIAGVGIVNTMLIAVKERIVEFGVLRSMGWTQDDVLSLVVTESVLLGLTGGLIGVGLGYAVTAALSIVLPFAPLVTLELSASAFLFSAAAGLVGGVYPAWRASKMDPIRALRGEML
jgi:putative ABC transport system permease protein